MEITEKVAYLKGLMEGMKIDTETNEGKILSAMVDILEDIGLELEDLWNAQGELEDGLDVVSDDLEDIEDIVYDEDDEDESFDDEYYEDDEYEESEESATEEISQDSEETAAGEESEETEDAVENENEE